MLMVSSHQYASGSIEECDYVDDRKHGLCISKNANGDIYEHNFVNGKKHGLAIEKFADGRIGKGYYENEKRTGTWEWYFPANDKRPVGFWCKVDFVNGE